MEKEITTEIVEEKVTLTSKVLEFIIGMLPILCIFLPTFLILFFFPNNIYASITANCLPMLIILFIVYYYIVVKGYRSNV